MTVFLLQFVHNSITVQILEIKLVDIQVDQLILQIFFMKKLSNKAATAYN
jgi:hypothetical protein